MNDNSLDSIISEIEHGQDPLQSSTQNSTSNNPGLTSENRGLQNHGTPVVTTLKYGLTYINDSVPPELRNKGGSGKK